MAEINMCDCCGKLLGKIACSNDLGGSYCSVICADMAEALEASGGPPIVEPLELPTPNMVESPPHYNAGKYEVIDIIEDSLRDIPGGFEAYMVGNIEKYIMRYRHKNGVEDLKKSRWYLGRLIAEVEKSAK